MVPDLNNIKTMDYLKITLFFFAGYLTTEANAQSNSDHVLPKNSFIIRIDSLEVDLYNNYEADNPPFDLNKLHEPTLFILDDKELKISDFSELIVDKENIHSVTIIQDAVEIKASGYGKFNSIVRVMTKKEED